MFTLTRKEFLDISWTREDLDSLTDLWLAWHEQARLKTVWRPQGYHSVQLRLWGFPRHEQQQLRERLRQNLKPLADSEPEIDASDPDYLTVETPFHDFAHPCSLGAWLAAVEDGAFEGLVVILQLSVHDWPGLPDGPAKAGGSIVICGQLRRDGFLLKALWPAGFDKQVESLYLKTAWPEEEKLLESLREFRQTGTIPAPAAHYFESRGKQRYEAGFLKLIAHLPEQGRLSSFLSRAGFHLACLTLVVCLFVLLRPTLFRRTLILAGIFFLFALGYVLFTELKRILAYHQRMNAQLKMAFSQTLEYKEVDFAQAGVADDPNLVKYSRQLEALDCRHVANLQRVGQSSSTSYTRIYALPADRIYFLLSMMTATSQFRFFPAKAIFFLVAYIADGRVVTVAEGGGFRKPLKANVFMRRFPEIDDPATLTDKHRQFLNELRSQGHTLARFPDLRELLSLMSKEQEETRQLYERYGYWPWSAAIRQNFQLVRREYLEPK